MKDEQRIVEWKLSPQVIEETEAVAAKVLEDMRAGRIAAAPRSPRIGAIWYHDWLESDLPPNVKFPLGMNHWLREPVFPDDHWLFGSDGSPPMSWLDLRNMMKARREARLEISVPKPAKRHKPKPSCLIRCIHAAFERVTRERIADWYFDLPNWQQDYVRAFIVAEARSDRLIRLAGDEIATRRAGYPVTMVVPSKRGSPRKSTRDAYMLAALATLLERFGDGELARPIWYEGSEDWCEAIAAVFARSERSLTPKRVYGIWGALSDRDQNRIHSPH